MVAIRWKRSKVRKDTCAGYYIRNIETKVGTVQLKVPELWALTFEIAIIEATIEVNAWWRRPYRGSVSIYNL